MPLYEYECDACGQRFEVIQKFSDLPTEVCARCGKGPVHRLLSSPAIQFKGSGWYITDYAKKGSSDGAKASSGDGGSDAGKSEAKTDAPSGTKTETKTESKAEGKAAAKP